VKICTLYGAGFYYLPGTDICVKQGAFVRAQYYYGWSGNTTNGPLMGTATQASQLKDTPNDIVWRTRAVYTLDARTQTEYGTLRSYVLIGYTNDSPTNEIASPTNPGAGAVSSLYATRGFIQFAGFTLGRATSFYDIFSNAANAYVAIWSSDTGDAGDNVAAYTFQFGNGFSATISAEDPRRAGVVNTSLASATATVFPVGGTPTLDQIQTKWPDVVANLRVDQVWGSLQVMGALHDASGGYFANSAGVTCGVTTLGGSLTGSLACGHPSDELGFAVGVGGIFKIPMPTGLTDIASFQVNYTEGALRYAIFSQPGGSSPGVFSATSLGTCGAAGQTAAVAAGPCTASLGLGFFTDSVFANPGAVPGYNGSVELTKAWGVNAAWDHLWTPNLKSSIYGAYINVSYNSTAQALIASAVCNGTAGTAAGGVNRLTNCSPDFNIWMLGSRTQWNITPSFYVGFDVTYMRLDTAFAGAGAFTAATGLPRPTGNVQISSQDTVAVTARAQWDILP
jgi:hypothetical protein